MGLFDNWSMDNFIKALTTPTTIDQLHENMVNEQIASKGGQPIDFSKGSRQLVDLNKFTFPGHIDQQTNDFLVNQQRQAEAERQKAISEQQAAEAKTKADKEARYQGAGFMEALQADMPQMFKKKEKPGAAAYGSPLGGGF